jgi:ferric-chelate reductase (NADPH)
MNEQSLPPRSESIPAGIRRTGLIESMLNKLLTRQARVAGTEWLNSKFRLITLQSESLKNLSWTPGDKIQVMLGGWVKRAYTPADYDPALGSFKILVHLHAGGPGTQWARTVKVGDNCAVFGPHGSIDLSRIQRPAVFFGDETTFGLAKALQATAAKVEGIKFLFELSFAAESLDVLELLGMPNASHCIRHEDEDYFSILERQMSELLDIHPKQFVLSGRSTAIQRLRSMLRRRGYGSSQFMTRPYWAPGKNGLD